MKRICVAVFLIAVTASAQSQQASSETKAAPAVDASVETPPAHPVTREQVAQLLELSRTTQIIAQTLHAGVASQRKIQPFLPDIFWDSFEAEAAKTDWQSLLVPVYQKHLSEEDAAKIIEFYRTPAGQRALAVTPVVMLEARSIGEARGRELGQMLAERYKAEIQASLEKYRKEHATPADQEKPAAEPPASSK